MADFIPPHTTHKVGILTKTDSTQRRVQIQEFDDRTTLDIRDWYKRKSDTTFSPGKGISIKLEDARKLKRLLAKAIKIAEKEGLLEPLSESDEEL